jgi:hypothetical protein
VVDLLVEALHAQTGLRQVAGDGDDPAVGGAEALDEVVDLALRPLAHEHVDGPVALQKLPNEVPADEARGARDEVVHSQSPRSSLIPRRVYPDGYTPSVHPY